MRAHLREAFLGSRLGHLAGVECMLNVGMTLLAGHVAVNLV